MDLIGFQPQGDTHWIRGLPGVRIDRTLANFPLLQVIAFGRLIQLSFNF